MTDNKVMNYKTLQKAILGGLTIRWASLITVYSVSSKREQYEIRQWAYARGFERIAGGPKNREKRNQELLKLSA
jgi:hypothetical protein